MRVRFVHRAVFVLLMICEFSICLGTEVSDSNDSNKYLRAVRTFADNVLKYGRDIYGPKQTPLFVDGLNIHTHEPVKWINSDGKKWILSNLASQQTLLRTLDGLSNTTGDPKYRKGAEEAIRYAFDHLRSPNGLFYWGHYVAYDAQIDEVQFPSSKCHILKMHYPYYELMWRVDSDATKDVIEAFWSAHVVNWSNLDFNRIAYYSDDFERPWNHAYKSTPVFFKGNRGGFFVTGSSLIQAATTLHRLSGQEEPLLWSKRLAKRFVDARHPNTGISGCRYNNLPLRKPLGDDLKDHFQNPCTRVFPFVPFEETRNTYYTDDVEAHDWASLFLVGETLKDEGQEFTKWALEELTAWGKASYRKKDNSFIPILTDGTSIEGYVAKERNTYGPEGAVAKPLFANLGFFWAYAMGYRTTGDEFMWEMTRNIVLGNSLGDIGRCPENSPGLATGTTCSDVYGLLGFLELYDKTNNPTFLHMARRIADNILAAQFHKGFFVPSKKHIYTRFDCFEPLALLRLVVTIEPQLRPVPQLWPSCPLFVPPYRYKQGGVDRLVIYDLTECPELPMSLPEAGAIGDLDLVRSLLNEGVEVDSWEGSYKRTALQRAARHGHKDVVEFLIDKGADINTKEDWPGGTPLHYATENGYKEVVEVLLARGADVNAKRTYPAGDRPLHSATKASNRDIVELLIDKGADVNAKNEAAQTPLDIAVLQKNKEIVELLKKHGAKE
jgi:pectate lyase